MQALVYVEIDVDYCSLSYGEGACTAVLGTDSAIKCFNTLKTCPKLADFDNAPVTLRFAMPQAYLPRIIDAIPSIQDVSYSPAIISLGQDLGQRAKVSVVLEDHPHSDTGEGFDKYVTERPYDPYKQGSFWGKFRARQPYLTGRPLRLIRGFVGQTLEEMETRHFLIESFDGPTPDGTFTLVAKDALKLLDGDRAQAPRPSNGFLASAINSSATSATLNPSGIGNIEYPASGLVNLGGKEICGFTRSGDTLTLTRGQRNTTAESHAANERAQLCLEYSAQTPAYIIHDLLTNYAEVDPAYIELSEWEDEVANFFGRLCTATIADPVAVNTLVSEIIQEAALALWWDELAQKLRIKVIRAVPATAEVFSEADSILEGSFTSQEQPDRRESTVQTFFGKRNPLEGQDDPSNYLSCAVTANDVAVEQYGANAIKRIFSRWIPFGGLTVAQRLNGLRLGRFRDPPRRFTFDVFRLSSAAPIMGAGRLLEAHTLQDATGAQEAVPLQITSVNPREDKFEVEAEEMRFDDTFLDDDDVNDRRITIDVSANNINLRTIHDTLYPAPTEGDAATVTVTCTIETGVTVGSNSTAAPAFNLGPWPTGWGADNIKIVVKGRVQGAGGAGGSGASNIASGGALATAGGAGGTAVYTRIGVTIDNQSQVWGGGGGGGGSGRATNSHPGGGGGGGAGTIIGSGGAKGAGGGYSETDGAAGTATAGGVGGQGAIAGPMYKAGDGGGPGAAGGTGTSPGTPPGGFGATGGAAGAAADGNSYVTWETTGSRAGSLIN